MPAHASFVLRVWRVAPAGRPELRAMLEDVATGERIGFANLADLLTFLQVRADDPAWPPAHAPAINPHKTDGRIDGTTV